LSDRDAHAEFLDAYYGWARHIYDPTRKYYLLGRDTVLKRLLEERWSTLVEVGPGTGRNLAFLNARRPEATLGGIEASAAMRDVCLERCPYARIEEGFAEDCDLAKPVGGPPDRVLFSYCLSMVQDPAAAIANARRQLAPGGQLVVVDFGQMERLPRTFRRVMRRFLDKWHVHPLDGQWLQDQGASTRSGGRGYWIEARWGAEVAAKAAS
jgi:S-adenosylmethionine-diacylgycerolhomoserine-N-methlytransferase